MSERDQALVERMGLPVSQVAHALGKSRQTVTRGINSPGDYFRPSDLLGVLDRWKTTDVGLYAVARRAICETFPEMADAILEATSQGSASSFAPLPGEYWLVSGDLAAFRANLRVCAEQVKTLCELDGAQMKFIVNRRDQKVAQRYEVSYRNNATQVIVCEFDLSLVPNTLLRTDMEGNVELFAPTDNGFAPLSRSEAARLRGVFRHLFPDAVDAN